MRSATSDIRQSESVAAAAPGHGGPDRGTARARRRRGVLACDTNAPRARPWRNVRVRAGDQRTSAALRHGAHGHAAGSSDDGHSRRDNFVTHRGRVASPSVLACESAADLCDGPRRTPRPVATPAFRRRSPRRFAIAVRQLPRMALVSCRYAQCGARTDSPRTVGHGRSSTLAPRSRLGGSAWVTRRSAAPRTHHCARPRRRPRSVFRGENARSAAKATRHDSIVLASPRGDSPPCKAFSEGEKACFRGRKPYFGCS